MTKKKGELKMSVKLIKKLNTVGNTTSIKAGGGSRVVILPRVFLDHLKIRDWVELTLTDTGILVQPTKAPKKKSARGRKAA